jgi:hypothetical protein
MDMPVTAPSAFDLLAYMSLIQATDFPTCLGSLLSERQKARKELHAFLLDHDFWIQRTSLDRYFNPKTTRMPHTRFLELFAEFLGLSDTERRALFDLWQMKRRRHGGRQAA